MMADLKGVHSGINMILRSKNEPELSLDDLLVMLFDEVEYVWPKLGYPPFGDSFQPVCEECCINESYAAGKRGRSLDNDR